MLQYYVKKSLQTRFFPFVFLFFIISALFLFLTTPNAYSVDLTLTWNENIEADIAGYRIYIRDANQEDYYDPPYWDGNNTTCIITDLDPNITYYFVARAYDILDNESSNSNEAIFSNGVVWESNDSGSNITGGCFIETYAKNSKLEDILRDLKLFFIDFFRIISSP